MRSVEELSETIIGTLCERLGFDNWWVDVDDDIKEEILEDIQQTVEEWLEE